ncbi:uncharacterized protein [Oscarella lobularis]|uniref:uncharacterized protein n=1 Tax=Oscarella lobularis TaxID=121494 RepID=UPI003313B919
MISTRKRNRVRPTSSDEIEKAEADEYRREVHWGEVDEASESFIGASSEDETDLDNDSLNLDEKEKANEEISTNDVEGSNETTPEAEERTETSSSSRPGSSRPRGNRVVPITSEEERQIRVSELEKLRETGGSREAWATVSESRRTSHSSLFSANRGPRARSESFASTVILVSEAEADRRLSVGNESLDTSSGAGTKTFQSDSTPSILAPPELKGEQQAYIPYRHAKQAIARVLIDVKSMRETHVAIVSEMTNEFKAIENDTQSHFDTFVLDLRKQYANKVGTFRQVIQLQQSELDKKSNYFERVIESLRERNQALIQEKRDILRESKATVLHVETQQKETVSKLIEELDKEKAAKKQQIASLLEEQEKSVAAVRSENEQSLAALVAEHEKLVAELKQEKESEVERMSKERKERDAEVEGLRQEVRSLSTTPQPEKDTSLVESLKTENAALEAKCLALETRLESVIEGKTAEERIETVKTEKEELMREKRDLEEKMLQWKERYEGEEEPPEEEGKLALEEFEKDLEIVQNRLEKKEATLFALKDEGAVAIETQDSSERIAQLEAQILELQEGRGDEEEIEAMKIELKSRDDLIENLRFEIERLKEGKSGEKEAMEATYRGQLKALQEDVSSKEKIVEDLKKIVEEMEEEKLSKMDVDTAAEIKKYIQRCNEAESVRDEKVSVALELQTKCAELESRIESQTRLLDQETKRGKELQESVARAREEREKALKVASLKEKKLVKEHSKVIKELEDKIRALESHPSQKVVPVTSKGGVTKDKDKDVEKLQSELKSLRVKVQEDASKVKALEKELKAAKAASGGGSSAEDKKVIKKQEKELKELAKLLEYSKRNLEKKETALASAEDELKELKKEFKKADEERKQLKSENEKLGVAAKEGLDYVEKAKDLTKQVAALEAEKRTLTENYNSERVLRKKYYNMVEDMKGKIRVFCRARPLSRSEKERGNHLVISSPDEYSIVVDTPRGVKEFQFDSVFAPEHGQEFVYEDTSRLIQSAVDGYNVCIFAYGQTGSGKTYTMVGELSMDSPIRGVAPRAMKQLFDVMKENSSKFSFSVSCYMLELYNDQLIDLFSEAKKEAPKLDIKKDKKGMVFVQGSVMKSVNSTQELFDLFEAGSQNRHVASTKMNAESSRSHLVFAVIVESTNLSNGQVLKGKLSLVDLAGSERAAKTGATAEQLREAQSINKSLSALGDVISALSSEQSFIPYRNNKLTMLMQDSLGGNAKTLMFVNISPADYNCDETVISLTYASRVKLITNDAQKNADNKEIARLKATIAKLRKGENIEEED